MTNKTETRAAEVNEDFATIAANQMLTIKELYRVMDVMAEALEGLILEIRGLKLDSVIKLKDEEKALTEYAKLGKAMTNNNDMSKANTRREDALNWLNNNENSLKKYYDDGYSGEEAIKTIRAALSDGEEVGKPAPMPDIHFDCLDAVKEISEKEQSHFEETPPKPAQGDLELAMTISNAVMICETNGMEVISDDQYEALTQAQPVDVEGLKFIRKEPHGKDFEDGKAIGWNDCLDHLTTNGYLQAPVDTWQPIETAPRDEIVYGYCFEDFDQPVIHTEVVDYGDGEISYLFKSPITGKYLCVDKWTPLPKPPTDMK